MRLLNGNKILSSVVAILVIWAISCRDAKSKEILIADYLLKEHLTTDTDSIEISNVLETLLENTKFRGKKQINRPYKSDLVNVYIIDGSISYIKEDAHISQLVNNCVYVGSNIIFLDVAYLKSFLNKHHVRKDSYSTQFINNQQCFLYWVIGHELGHLLCNHLAGHFESGSLEEFVNSSSIDNKAELQADSVFVHTISSNTNRRISVERLMLNILNAEIEQKVGVVEVYGVGIHYDYTNKNVVTYARQPTHPEYVIRLARMIELSSKLSGDKGLHNLVSGFIKHLKEAK